MLEKDNFDSFLYGSVLDELGLETTEDMLDIDNETNTIQYRIPPPQIPPSPSNTVPCFLKGTKY